MQHHPTLDVMKRAVRARVCVECFLRPHGSEKLGPEVPRICEPQCTIFINLAKLQQVAMTVSARDLGPYEAAMRELICQQCENSATAGDYCAERSTRSCPLSRYAGTVVETLDKLAANWRRGIKQFSLPVEE